MQFVNGLHFNNIRGDVYGGLTAAVVALPLALAFGVSSGAGPIAGLYGAIFVGFFAALFGGTPAQVSGPTGPMTVVMALIFTHYIAMFPEDPSHGAALAFTVVILAGLFQIGFGFLHIGRFIEMVPHPVVSGFMSGIGVIIILLQIGPLVGLDSPSKPIEAAKAIPDFYAHSGLDAEILALIALSIVYAVPRLLPKLNKLFPSPLIALIVGTLAMVILMPESEAPILGDIPTGIPVPQMPVFELALVPGMIESALTLALLGTIDSLLTSLVADNITRTLHKPDRELIGQGIGNMVAGIFGGLPGAGATMRTVVNVKAGGKTPISGALHAVILLVVILGAGPLASAIPKAVLAGILVKVGTDIIDWNYLKRLRTAPKAGVMMMFVVFFLTVFVDLIMAVAVGMVMASMVFMHRMTKYQLENVSLVRGGDTYELPLNEKEQALLDKAGDRLLLFHLAGPMSFSAAKGVIRRFYMVDGYEAMILDMTDVSVIDFTSCRAVEDIILAAMEMTCCVYLCGIKGQVAKMLKEQRVVDNIEPGYLTDTREQALELVVVKLEELEELEG